jgi:tartrate-resistant acid phosphatase type 5
LIDSPTGFEIFISIPGFFLYILLLLLLLFSYKISAKLQRFEHPTKGDGALRFLVVGDWGRKGEFNQSKVAFQMGISGEE